MDKIIDEDYKSYFNILMNMKNNSIEEVPKTSYNLIQEIIDEIIIPNSKNHNKAQIMHIYASVCEQSKKNINILMIGIKNSYIELIKLSIRNQIELNQKLTLLLLVKSKIDILNVHQDGKEVLKSKITYNNIKEYWNKIGYTDIDKIQKYKNDAHIFIHPSYCFKPLVSLDITNISKYIYVVCGGKKSMINEYLYKISYTPTLKKRITEECINEIKKNINNLFNEDLNVFTRKIQLFILLLIINLSKK